MPSRAQDCASAPAELRSSAVAFTPGEKVHMTPVKVSTPAAEDEDELCTWLREKACLHKEVIEKSMGKLHTEDVYDVAGLSALRDLGGLRDVFSRVPASQIASALDRMTISNTEPAPPAGLTTPPPRAASTAAVQGITGRGIVLDAAPESQQPEAAAENDRKETASLPEPTRTQMGGELPLPSCHCLRGSKPLPSAGTKLSLHALHTLGSLTPSISYCSSSASGRKNSNEYARSSSMTHPGTSTSPRSHWS